MLDEQAFLILSLVNISILEAPFMKTKLLLLTIPVLLICACNKESNNSSSTYSFPRETKPYRPSKEITEVEAALPMTVMVITQIISLLKKEIIL